MNSSDFSIQNHVLLQILKEMSGKFDQKIEGEYSTDI